MTLHLIKLCVGVETVDDLAEWIDLRKRQARSAGEKYRHIHVTRMTPRRVDDLLDDGSLYWVIKGNIQVREALVGIEPFTDNEGTHRCRLILSGKLVPTAWQPRRPFQGWRYLEPKDAPLDQSEAGASELPASLTAELSELGLR